MFITGIRIPQPFINNRIIFLQNVARGPQKVTHGQQLKKTVAIILKMLFYTNSMIKYAIIKL